MEDYVTPSPYLSHKGPVEERLGQQNPFPLQPTAGFVFVPEEDRPKSMCVTVCRHVTSRIRLPKAGNLFCVDLRAE